MPPWPKSTNPTKWWWSVSTNQFVQLVHRDGFMVDCPVAQSPADTITKLFGDEPIEDEDFETWQHTFDTAAEDLMLRVLTEGLGTIPPTASTSTLLKLSLTSRRQRAERLPVLHLLDAAQTVCKDRVEEAPDLRQVHAPADQEVAYQGQTLKAQLVDKPRLHFAEPQPQPLTVSLKGRLHHGLFVLL